MKITLTPTALYIVWILTFLVDLINGFFAFETTIPYVLLRITGLSLHFFWVTKMVLKTKYLQTKFGKWTYSFVSIIILGLLFKIQHWPYANLILIIGFCGLKVIYFTRFWLKKHKQLLDILKVLWLVTTATNALLILLHLINKDFSIINTLLFLVLIGVFVLDHSRHSKIR